MVSMSHRVVALEERVAALDRWMETKFVTVEAMMRYQAEKVALALNAAQTAIDKAEIADEKSRDRLAEDIKGRFVYVNELRGALSDSQANNVTRAEFDAFRQNYSEQHIILRDQHAKELADLRGRLDRAEGRQGGVANVWGVIVAVAGIAIAIGALVFRNA